MSNVDPSSNNTNFGSAVTGAHDKLEIEEVLVTCRHPQSSILSSPVAADYEIAYFLSPHNELFAPSDDTRGCRNFALYVFVQEPI